MTKGERIKHRREQLGISQTELAECIGTSKQNLYKYENDIITNIPSDRVEALAKKLNTSPAYIMGWNEEDALPAPTITEDTVTFPIVTSVAAHYDGVSRAPPANTLKCRQPTSKAGNQKSFVLCVSVVTVCSLRSRTAM